MKVEVIVNIPVLNIISFLLEDRVRVRLKVRMCVQGSGFRGFRVQGVQGSG